MNFLIGSMTILTVVTLSLLCVEHVRAVASSPWSQTDWSGGEGADTGTQFSTSVEIATLPAGQFSLNLGEEKFSNTGFESDVSDWSPPSSWDFDGVDEYIDIDDSSDFTFGDGTTDSPFSVSFWFKTSDLTWAPFVNKGRFANTSEWLIYAPSTTDKIRFTLINNGVWTERMEFTTATGYSSLEDNAWHHIVVTYDGLANSSSSGAIYIDGSSVGINGGASTYTAMSDGAQTVKFGRIHTNEYYLDGSMADVAIFNKELTSDEVSDIYNSGEPRNEILDLLSGDIVGYWRGDGSINSTDGVIDQTGNGNPGTMTNMEDGDIVADYPGSSEAAISRSTSKTYNSSSGSAQVVTGDVLFNFAQVLNVGDTEEYILVAYVYTDGSEVTDSDVELYANGSTLDTTYEDQGDGWYKLTAALSGSASNVVYGAQIKAGKTVYLDDLSLRRYVETGTLTSAIFDVEVPAIWGTLTYNTSGTGTTAVKVRSDSSSDMSTATDFASCTAISSGTDISSNDCVDDLDQYLQYQVTLTATDTSATPSFEDISVSFVTDITAPVVSGSSVTNITNTSATISWETDEEASTKINYGTSTAYELSTLEKDTSPRVYLHTQTLTGLAPCTTYYYQASTTDAFNNEDLSLMDIFQTTGCEASIISGSTAGNTNTSGVVSETETGAQEEASEGGSEKDIDNGGTHTCDPGTNLVQNGSFEEPKVRGNWALFPHGTDALGWGVVWASKISGAPLIAGLEIQSENSGEHNAFDGVQYAELDSDWIGLIPENPEAKEKASTYISQDLPTVAGREYKLSFTFAPVQGRSPTQNHIQALVDGQVVIDEKADGTNNVTNVWTEYTHIFKAYDYFTEVGFRDAGLPNTVGTLLDNVVVTCLEEGYEEEEEDISSSSEQEALEETSEEGTLDENTFEPEVVVEPEVSTTTEPASSGGGSGSTALLKNKITTEGDRGEPVKSLQQLLNEKIQANLKEDAIFGPRTKQAVIEFQVFKNITIDGIVGPETTEALEEEE